MIKIIWMLVPEENAKRHPHEHRNTKNLKTIINLKFVIFFHDHLISRIVVTQRNEWHPKINGVTVFGIVHTCMELFGIVKFVA